DAAVMALPMLISVVLFGQFLAGAQRYGPRHSIVPGTVIAHWGGLAASSAMAVLAAVAWVVQYTAARQALHQDDGPEPRRWLRDRSLGAAWGAGAVLGLGVTALYAAIAAGYLEVPAAPF